MEKLIGTSNRVLEIDLTTQAVKIVEISVEDRRLFLGGKGLGLKLVYERLKPGIDPLGPDNILAFMMGVFMATGAPCSGRFAAVTKSPLTGIMASSSCGGPFGMALKTAGYDGLLISGASEKPIYLLIKAEGVRFEEATQLWGKGTVETQEILRELGTDGILAIGPAGENKVLYANIASGTRFLGRAGLGAVMGSKHLKAIVAQGKHYQIIPHQLDTFQKLKRVALQRINNNNFTGHLYRNYGTAANVNLSNRGGILSVFNFRDGQHERAGDVAGEIFEAQHQTKSASCKPCSILCGKKGTFATGVQKIPEYETIGLLGSNLGIFDREQIVAWNELAGNLGLDTISLGGTLAYFMEAGEKGFVNTRLKMGSAEYVAETIEDIAYRRHWGNELANGSRWLSQKYGGAEFAIQVKGLELPAYDPRGSWGQGLAYAVANRGGCHLSATLFPLEVYFAFLNPTSVRAKAQFVVFLENLFAIVNSLHTCVFTAFAYVLEAPVAKYTPQPLLALTIQYLSKVAIQLMDLSLYRELYGAITGLTLSRKEFLAAGERIHLLERWMNTREGITRKDDTLPWRFLHEGRLSDPAQKTVPLEKMLHQYYRIRDYDENGIPAKSKLTQLGILKLPSPVKI